MEHAGIIADIESQLTQAAELVLNGNIPEALFSSVIRGALLFCIGLCRASGGRSGGSRDGWVGGVGGYVTVS